MGCGVYAALGNNFSMSLSICGLGGRGIALYWVALGINQEFGEFHLRQREYCPYHDAVRVPERLLVCYAIFLVSLTVKIINLLPSYSDKPLFPPSNV